MSVLTISEVARQVGVKPSAIRYYEQVGVLRRPERVSGQRRYDEGAAYRLAVVVRARQLGFTLDEIRELFFGFRTTATASDRWKALTERKLAELEETMQRIRAMQDVLRRLNSCPCDALERCGRGMLQRLREERVLNRRSARRG
jgi:MerR family transcriptional regulator, redox-sensitive transcriptional activator SoxR